MPHVNRLTSRLASWFASLSLFTRVFIYIVCIILVTVVMAEAVLEPLVADILGYPDGELEHWGELAVWSISIAVPALISGYILTKRVSNKLGSIAKATQALIEGNLEMRLPIEENGTDAFYLLRRNFNRMADSIFTVWKSQRRLLADISHEMRSPLARLRLSAALIQRGEDMEKTVALAQRMEKEIEHMSEMVEQLLCQSQTMLYMEIPSEPVDLGAVLGAVAEDFAFQAEYGGKRISLRPAGELHVYGKAILLRIMLSNVIANALYYTDRTVLITASHNNEEAEIVVRDFGPGVPEEQLEAIFRAFYRLDDARTRERGGSGLGLALAKETAVTHGGSIKAANCKPGLEITIRLPLYKSGMLEDAHPAAKLLAPN